MRAFEFPLRQALAWRRTQLETERNTLRQLVAKVEELAQAALRLDQARNRAELAVREATAVDAADLWAWAAYRQRMLSELRALAARKRECEQQVAAQRERTQEAERRCRLLEKLEERRRAAWRIEADRETESLASESFLARWNRQPH
jgi:flagellar export protein FliJ